MALFNGGFPATYQPIYPQYQQPYQIQMQQPQIPQTQQNMQQQQNIIWVEGEADARSFQLAPNTTMPLWDRNAQVIYYKSSDASGMPSLKILDYTIRDQNAQNSPVNVSNSGNTNIKEYVTKAEFEAMSAKYDALKADFDSFCAKSTVKQQKKGAVSDE